ncbi:hypothetical protein KIH86_21335 [Paenibacillus sp. HN-1]|uniref:hypothetical protein n=1 Tax=Paenibacillus TaxID=44249 RepID=UPI001CA7E5CE|nr:MULTISPECIES: hypothetical protein [Paenibacillus]MBY9080053.1 hypothetical protein [Paenibacillus sp. CGMCC 1.18879]MBY9086751.1 hypothetical protein [Paenibacillus sinensis]
MSRRGRSTPARHSQGWRLNPDDHGESGKAGTDRPKLDSRWQGQSRISSASKEAGHHGDVRPL